MQRGAKARHEEFGRQRQPFLQHVHQPQAAVGRRGARLADVADVDGVRREAGHTVVEDVHCRFPASSKIGMYMRITMPPISTPMKAISNGSNRRVNQSTQREISSSWKAAMRSIISPMSPPRSPTASMRSATGVVRSLASMDWD